MELLDIRDEHGKKTGKIIERGQPMAESEYVLGVFVMIRDHRGNYLIQKRPLSKKIFPGKWDLTGGAVLSGENSKEAAIREVLEEVGLHIYEDALVYVGRLHKRNRLVDIWLTDLDFALQDCTICTEEVDALELVSPEIMLHRIFDKGRIEEDYNVLLEAAIKI
jgi:8-oxo-dGTP pyrophosphatase MutT (NUDIX family)